MGGNVTFLLCSVGGWLAYRYLHLAGSTYRALATIWTRARKGPVIARLRRERAEIFEAAMELSRDLDLPGGVAPDGRVVSAERASGATRLQ